MTPPSRALVVVRRITRELPEAFDRLREEARREGFDHIERLAADWTSGALRFDRAGERLLAAEIDGSLAGLGGLTLEPGLPGALRLRRFYTRPAFRNAGVGRVLAAALLRHALDLGREVTLNAVTPAAAAYWDRLGFARKPGSGFTHRWVGAGPPTFDTRPEASGDQFQLTGPSPSSTKAAGM